MLDFRRFEARTGHLEQKFSRQSTVAIALHDANNK